MSPPRLSGISGLSLNSTSSFCVFSCHSAYIPVALSSVFSFFSAIGTSPAYFPEIWFKLFFSRDRLFGMALVFSVCFFKVV